MASTLSAMQSLTLPMINDREVETDPAKMSDLWKKHVLGIVRKKGAFLDADLQSIYEILKAFRHIQTIDAAIDNRLGVSWILQAVMGTEPRLAKFSYSFPDALKNDAQVILDDLTERIRVAEETAAAVRQADEAQRRTSVNQAATSAQRQLHLSSDPGIREMMRGIDFRTKKILPGTVRRDYNIAGDNGIELGQWWPFQKCALRDGAHGQSQSGISGSEASGCFSIVVSKGSYEDLDQDNGDTILYSCAGAHESEDPHHAPINSGIKALRRSLALHRPIRVLRAAANNRRYAPSVGLRYDGLYHIVNDRIETNHKGGKYVRFRLDRAPGQPPLPLDRPTRRERALFDHFQSST